MERDLSGPTNCIHVSLTQHCRHGVSLVSVSALAAALAGGCDWDVDLSCEETKTCVLPESGAGGAAGASGASHAGTVAQGGSAAGTTPNDGSNGEAGEAGSRATENDEGGNAGATGERRGDENGGSDSGSGESPGGNAVGGEPGRTSGGSSGVSEDGGAAEAGDDGANASGGNHGGGSNGAGGTGGRLEGFAGSGTGGTMAAGGYAGTDSGTVEAGAAGSTAVAVLEIAPSSLPMAQYGKEYSVTLSASGGEPDYDWTVSSGDLPAGLQLSSTGTLSGTPTVDGDFEFEVTVKDANGAEETIQLGLRVQRKRWLAYLADEDTLDQDLLTLVDVTNAAYPRTRVPTPAGSSVQQFSFSPNGHWLAYDLLDADGTSRLYLMDVSGRTLGESMRIGGPLDAAGVEWTPGGEAFSFGQKTGEEAGLAVYETRFVDLGQTLPPAVVPMPGVRNGTWITDQLLASTSLQGQLSFIRRTGAGFGNVQTLNVDGGTITRVAPIGERISVVAGLWSCTGDSWIIDFSGPTVFALPGVSSMSADFQWFTLPDGTDTTRTAFHRYSDLPNSSAVATIPASACASARPWAHTRAAVAWVDYDSSSRRVHVTELGGPTVASHEITGTYAAPSSDSDIFFSPDDEWIAFRSDSGTYLASVDGDANSFSTSSTGFSFSPDSNALACWDDLTEEVPGDELYLLEWRSGLPATHRAIYSASLQYMSLGKWSSDGRYLTYSGAQTSSEGGGLFVVDVFDTDDTGTQVSPRLWCSGWPCRGVGSSGFQP